MLSLNPPTPSSNPRQPRKRKLRNKEDKIQTPKINTFFKAKDRDRNLSDDTSSLQGMESISVQKTGSTKPQLSKQEQRSNSVQGDNFLTSFQLSGIPALVFETENLISLSEQSGIEFETKQIPD